MVGLEVVSFKWPLTEECSLYSFAMYAGSSIYVAGEQ